MPGQTLGITLSIGFAGTFSRSGDTIISSAPINQLDPFPAPFGSALFGSTYAGNSVPYYSSTQSLQASILATTSNTSTTLTGITSTSTCWNNSPILVGMQVVGAGIQTGTVVTAILSSTSVSISLPATASGTVLLSFLSAWLATSNFVGVACREVKQSSQYILSSVGEYRRGTTADAVERGSIAVVAPSIGGITPYGQVWLRIGINPATPYLPVGGFEGQADGVYSVPLPNASWTTGQVDPTTNTVEMVLRWRNRG